MSQLLYSKDYAPNEFKELAKIFGYKQRVDTYYVFKEQDGYINISYEYRGIKFDGSPYKEIFTFHKNHYQNVIDSSTGLHKKDIHFDSEEFKEFEEWMCKYHLKQGRKYKLKKLEDVKQR